MVLCKSCCSNVRAPGSVCSACSVVLCKTCAAGRDIWPQANGDETCGLDSVFVYWLGVWYIVNALWERYVGSMNRLVAAAIPKSTPRHYLSPWTWRSLVELILKGGPPCKSYYWRQPSHVTRWLKPWVWVSGPFPDITQTSDLNLKEVHNRNEPSSQQAYSSVVEEQTETPPKQVKTLWEDLF